MRPYAAAPSAAAKSRASSRTRSAGIAGRGLGALGRMLAGEPLEHRRAVAQALEEEAVGEALLEDHREHREQQPGVRVRADREMLELARRLGAARVDHHHPLDLEQLLADPRRRQHRAVRDERVRAHHEQEATCARRSGIGITSGEPYSSALAAKRLFTSCEPAE